MSQTATQSDEIKQIELQLIENRKKVDYRVSDPEIVSIVDQYAKGDIFIPYYQREFIWDKDIQSKFIESVLLDIPIPTIFVAETSDGQMEIIDGSQRIRTLHAFKMNELTLQGLPYLSKINGYIYERLPEMLKRKFNNTSLKFIRLTDKTDADTKFILFERINTNINPLKEMEKRSATAQGLFLELIQRLAKDELLLNNCSFTEYAEKRLEPQELLVRFFAYTDKFPTDIKYLGAKFINNYIEDKNNDFKASPDLKSEYEARFKRVFSFINAYLPKSFIRANIQKTPRLRFEAISVGTYFALIDMSENELNTLDQSWLESERFLGLISDTGTNTKKSLDDRIGFVYEQLTGNPHPRKSANGRSE